ncbi:MAG: ADYC domain-containing protein [Pseudomonadota bacterium]
MKNKRIIKKMLMMVIVIGMSGWMEACELADEGRSDVGVTTSPITFWVPPSNPLASDLIGRGLNGMSMNGQVLDGHSVVAVSLEDVQLRSGHPRDLGLEGTVFPGTYAPGRDPERQRIVGAVFSAILDDGEAIALRIDSVGPGMSDDSYLEYAVSYLADDGWVPMCGTDEEGLPVLAIPLKGLWNYDAGTEGGGSHVPDDSAFTFACKGHVLAKCVDMGYKPWVEGLICPDERRRRDCVRGSLAGHHQACTRLLRADYCGDGVSHTEDDVLVNYYDGFGIRLDSEDWDVEAEWTADGARCVTGSMRGGLEDTPACLADLSFEDCGDFEHFEGETLLISELQPAG